MLEPALSGFYEFIRAQLDNLRSNNMRNALTLMFEIFMGQERQSAHLRQLIKACMSNVLARTAADKVFLASVAKKTITAAVENCPCFEMSEVLIEVCHSKNLTLAELSVTQLALLVKCADKAFFKDPQADSLISAMCLVLEGKKTRMVKNAVPVMQEFKAHIGKEALFARALAIFQA